MVSRRLYFACLIFVVALSSSFSRVLAEGRYGLAPTEDLVKIQAWAEGQEERYWIQGEKAVFYFDPLDEVSALPFGDGLWRPLVGQTFFLFGAHALPDASQELLRGGRVRLIESTMEQAMTLDEHAAIKPVIKNHSLVQSLPKAQPTTSQMQQAPIPIGQKLDGDQWRRDVETLSGWSRYSYGDTISLAQTWLKESFQAIPGLVVSEFPFSMPSGNGGQRHCPSRGAFTARRDLYRRSPLRQHQ